MSALQDLLDRYVAEGWMPGAVAMVARGDEAEVAVAGHVDLEHSAPMARTSLMRLASVTKPVTAAVLMQLIEAGRLALDSPIARWLPELSAPMVVRTPRSPIDDVVPADRPITVEDLLTFRAGWGFPSDFSLPAVQPLFAVLHQGPTTDGVPPTDRWLQLLSEIPLLHQPGEGWLYNTGSDIQGALIERVTGQSLPDVMAERVFDPLGMADTGFRVPSADRDRLVSAYRPTPEGGLCLVDPPDGLWSQQPEFFSGAGGLVSTVDDLAAFGRMLLAGGRTAGHRLLSSQSVAQMMTNHLSPDLRGAGALFLEGEGWGYGGSVDVAGANQWNVPGRYGWVGGTGTALHVTPATGTLSVLLTQREMTGPTTPALMREFWTLAGAG